MAANLNAEEEPSALLVSCAWFPVLGPRLWKRSLNTICCVSAERRSPGSNTAPLVFITTTIPLLQTFTLLLSIVALALEWPLPMVRRCVARLIIYAPMIALTRPAEGNGDTPVPDSSRGAVLPRGLCWYHGLSSELLNIYLYRFGIYCTSTYPASAAPAGRLADHPDGRLRHLLRHHIRSVRSRDDERRDDGAAGRSGVERRVRRGASTSSFTPSTRTCTSTIQYKYNSCTSKHLVHASIVLTACRCLPSSCLSQALHRHGHQEG